MSSPSASTKSLNSTSPDAQNATSDPKAPVQPMQNGRASGDSDENETNEQTAPEGGYPEQKHAGAVGLGPEYGKMREATASDKMMGLKDEIIGKVTRNPEKVEHGREMRTGELKKKKWEEGNNADPFSKADGGDQKKKGSEEKGGKGKGEGEQGDVDMKDEGKQNEERPKDDKGLSGTEHDQGDNVAGNAASTSVTGKRGPGTHPTEMGAQEQAATTAPEGTDEAERQRKGEVVDGDKQIDESSSKKPRTG